MIYKKNTLSVCIVLFNRWELSKQTIESIINTVPKDWEIEWNVIDNGSSMEHRIKVENYFYKLLNRGKVKYLECLEEGLKQTQAVNRTLNAATGEYVLRTDNDIKYVKGWFENCYAILNDENFKNLGFICPTHHVRQVNQNYKPNLVYGKDKSLAVDLVSKRNQNVPCNILYKNSVSKDIGGFYTPYNLLHADVHYCLVAKHIGYDFAYTWNIQCEHLGGIKNGEYFAKAAKERQDENKRFEEICKGGIRDKHPQEVEFAQQLTNMRKTQGKKLSWHNGINILITSSGRRVELIKMFREVFEIPRWNGKIFTAGLDSHMPTAYVSDHHFVVPSIADKDYIDVLIEKCKTHDIKYIFPVIDFDIKVLSKNKTRFLREAGTEVICLDEKEANICFDKLETYNFFKRLKIPTPNTYVPMGKSWEGNGRYIAKPRFGFGSKNVRIFNDTDMIKLDSDLDVVQDFHEGWEYTTDIVSNRMNQIISLVSRKREAVRGGEIQDAEVVNQLHLFHYFNLISKSLKLIGPWCVQYIVTPSGNVVFIEVNARFGGGVPISSRAGQNQALQSLKVLERDFFGYHHRYLVEWGLKAFRYDDCVYRHISEVRGDHDVKGRERLKG